MLAGVSLTWYTWLEQGRRINASRDVLVAIGRALRLDDAGLEHLLSLAEPGTAGVVEVPATPPAALERLLDALMPSPAYVLGPRWEFLAWNGAQERLYPRLPSLEPPRRNLLWVLFADPFTRGTDRRLGHPRPSGPGGVPFRHVGGPPRSGDGRTDRDAPPRVGGVRPLVAGARRLGIRGASATVQSSDGGRAHVPVPAASRGPSGRASAWSPNSAFPATIPPNA